MDDEQGTRDMARLDYEDHRLEVYERLKIQSAMAEAGLKSLMLVNAGAIVGLFTFIGNGATQIQVRPEMLWPAFGCFVSGMAATVIANIAAFFAQGFYYRQTQKQAWNDQAVMLGRTPKEKPNRFYYAGFAGEIIGVIGALAALICFVRGAFLAFQGVLPT